MPIPSYLSTFCTPPSHTNAYRRVLADEKIDFSNSTPIDQLALVAAQLFLPPADRHPDLDDARDASPLVQLSFHGNAHAGADLEAKFFDIAHGLQSGTVNYRNFTPEEKGREVLKSIADAIFPALNTGNIGRTEMARAAALEIAIAIANPRNLSIGARAACNAVNGEHNDINCALGAPVKRGVGIHAYKGRISLCESNDWDCYHRIAAPSEQSKSAGKRATVAGTPSTKSEADSRNVACQDAKILIADVCTTFTVKTGEWWLTRKLLPRRTQHATLGARIEMLHLQSPDPTLQKALGYEGGTTRHRFWNWVAFLFRFMRGIAIGNVDKREFEREFLRMRVVRGGLRVPIEDAGMQEAQREIDQCLTIENRSVELIDDDARRVGRRSGTWGDRARYQGKLDLQVAFDPGKPVAAESQTVGWHGPSAARPPAYQALGRAAVPAQASGPQDTAASSSAPKPEFVPPES